MKYFLLMLIFIGVLNSQDNKYTNSLINSDSPYLLQHAHNPIDWMIWDKKLYKKQKRNKLFFIYWL